MRLQLCQLCPAVPGCQKKLFPVRSGVFPQGRRPGSGAHSAVLSVSVSMSNRTWLCSSLPAASAGSSGGGFASGSGILELESAQKGNSEFSSCSLIHPGIPGRFLTQRRESKDQRRLLNRAVGTKG